MPVGEGKAQAAIERVFGRLLVARARVLSASVPVRAIVFLPPQHHVLLKFSLHSEGLVVDMACDYWPLLSHLNAFLSSVLA